MKTKQIHYSIKMLRKAFKYTDLKEEQRLIELINQEIDKLSENHQGLNDSVRYWKNKLLS